MILRAFQWGRDWTLGLALTIAEKRTCGRGAAGEVGAFLMGSNGAFITTSDFLMDGGVAAVYWYGELAPNDA